MKKNKLFMFEIATLAVIALGATLSIADLTERGRVNWVSKETAACFQKYKSTLMLELKTVPRESESHRSSADRLSTIYKFVLPIELPKIHSVEIPVIPAGPGVDAAEWVRFYVFMAGDLKNPISNGVRYLGPLSASEWKVVLSAPIVKELHGDYVDFYVETNVFDQSTLKRKPVSSSDISISKICSQIVDQSVTSYKKINIKVSGGT